MTNPQDEKNRARAFGEPSEDDAKFDPWRVPAGPSMAAVVATVLAEINQHETAHGLRDRKRRPADQQSHEAAVSGLVCDLAYRHLTGHEGRIFVSRNEGELGRKSRYKAPALTSKFPEVLDRLISIGLIEEDRATGGEDMGHRRTTIWPTPNLIERLANVEASHITRTAPRETIVLRAKKDEDGWADRPSGRELSYDDTKTTKRHRAEMQAINEWLRGADIDFDDTVLLDQRKWVDTSRRSLYRVFTNGSFKSGGRLYGGFWQGLRATERAAGLTIDGEEVALLDYGQIGPRIAYYLAGAKAPQVDLYSVPGLEGWRDGVKQVINAALNHDKVQSRKPRGSADKLPAAWTMPQIMEAVHAAHAPIAPHFGTGMGQHIVFIESGITVKVLLDLRAAGVVSLPVHDELIVPRSMGPLTAEILKAAYRDATGGDQIAVTMGTWSPSENQIIEQEM